MLLWISSKQTDNSIYPTERETQPTLPINTAACSPALTHSTQFDYFPPSSSILHSHSHHVRTVHHVHSVHMGLGYERRHRSVQSEGPLKPLQMELNNKYSPEQHTNHKNKQLFLQCTVTVVCLPRSGRILSTHAERQLAWMIRWNQRISRRQFCYVVEHRHHCSQSSKFSITMVWEVILHERSPCSKVTWTKQNVLEGRLVVRWKDGVIWPKWEELCLVNTLHTVRHGGGSIGALGLQKVERITKEDDYHRTPQDNQTISCKLNLEHNWEFQYQQNDEP